MHPKVEFYIAKINSNDPGLTEINLSALNLTDNDMAPLMEALANNQNVAQKIVKLDFSENCLTKLDLSNLPSLINLFLDCNDFSNIDLFNLLELTTLDLADNNFITVDLSKQNKLIYLDLAVNEMVTIPNLDHLNELKTLKLHNNPCIKHAPKIVNCWRKYQKTLFAELALVEDSIFAFENKEYSTKCLISHDVMTHPAVLTTSELDSDGVQKVYKHVFDYKNINTWLKTNKTNPVNRIECSVMDLQDFPQLKKFIRDGAKLKAAAVRFENLNDQPNKRLHLS